MLVRLTFDKDIFLANLRDGSIGGELETVKAVKLGDLPLLLGRRHAEKIRRFDISFLSQDPVVGKTS